MAACFSDAYIELVWFLLSVVIFGDDGRQFRAENSSVMKLHWFGRCATCGAFVIGSCTPAYDFTIVGLCTAALDLCGLRSCCRWASIESVVSKTVVNFPEFEHGSVPKARRAGPDMVQ